MKAALVGVVLGLFAFWLFPLLFDVGYGTVAAILVVGLYISWLPIRKKF